MLKPIAVGESVMYFILCGILFCFSAPVWGMQRYAGLGMHAARSRAALGARAAHHAHRRQPVPSRTSKQYATSVWRAPAPEADTTQEDLIRAIRDGETETVRQLLDAGVDVKEKGATPLMEAACCGRSVIARMLLEAGADVNARDDNGHTASDVAGLEGHENTRVMISRWRNEEE